jgi:hypothetical protein
MVNKYFSSHPTSMVIPGLILNRLDNKLDFDKVLSNFKMFKGLNPKNEIVISTYLKELPKTFLKYTDKVVINDDPGPDIFVNDRWIFMHEKSPAVENNFSRFFLTNYNGIRACSNNLVLKARIEMMPSDPKLLIDLIEDYQESRASNNNVLGFFAEHYSGIFHSIDGVLGGIPGTVQIGAQDTLEKLYCQSLEFWTREQKRLTRKSNRHPLTSEQILGLNFLNLYCDFPLNTKLDKLGKYYGSSKLIKSILNAEVNYFKFLSLKQSGFVINKYQGTYFINTPSNLDTELHDKFLLKLVVVFLKRYKHMFRRFRSSFLLRNK